MMTITISLDAGEMNILLRAITLFVEDEDYAEEFRDEAMALESRLELKAWEAWGE